MRIFTAQINYVFTQTDVYTTRKKQTNKDIRVCHVMNWSGAGLKQQVQYFFIDPTFSLNQAWWNMSTGGRSHPITACYPSSGGGGGHCPVTNTYLHLRGFYFLKEHEGKYLKFVWWFINFTFKIKLSRGTHILSVCVVYTVTCVICYVCVCVCFAGVLLHIMADTLGSVGVIISALLMQKYDLMIADPICSMLISLLIGVRWCSSSSHCAPWTLLIDS